MTTERDRIRAEILKSRPPQSKIITFFGEQIEIKQLTLGAILDAGKEEDTQGALISTLVKYAFIPGTDIRVFDPEDLESLKALPFGGDFVGLADAIQELTKVSFPMPGGDSNSKGSSPGATASPTS